MEYWKQVDFWYKTHQCFLNEKKNIYFHSQALPREFDNQFQQICRHTIERQRNGRPFTAPIVGLKLMLANSQNASDFDNLIVRKMFTSKHLLVGIIHVSETVRKNLLVVLPVCWWKKSYYICSQTLQVD